MICHGVDSETKPGPILCESTTKKSEGWCVRTELIVRCHKLSGSITFDTVRCVPAFNEIFAKNRFNSRSLMQSHAVILILFVVYVPVLLVRRGPSVIDDILPRFIPKDIDPKSREEVTLTDYVLYVRLI